MKIGPLESKPTTAPAAPERKAASAPAAPAAQASAQVELSPAATMISGLATDPSFDAAKVEKIAQAIRDGKFTVNPEAIADKLIVNAEELLGRKLS
jgi:negative regulator of flagellin synthesis FlgM